MSDRLVVLCDNCKYRRGIDSTYWKCAAHGYKYCEFINTRGECETWRAREGQPTSLVLWAGAGIGSVLASLLWWVLQ